MITKTYFHFLPEVGRGITYKANDIVSLINRKEELLRKIKSLEQEIKDEEESLLTEVKKDWTDEEIQEAKQKYQEYIN